MMKKTLLTLAFSSLLLASQGTFASSCSSCVVSDTILTWNFATSTEEIDDDDENHYDDLTHSYKDEDDSDGNEHRASVEGYTDGHEDSSKDNKIRKLEGNGDGNHNNSSDGDNDSNEEYTSSHTDGIKVHHDDDKDDTSSDSKDDSDWTDILLIDFGEACVTLTDVDLVSEQGFDTEYGVYAYTGNTFDDDFLNLSYSELETHNWTLVDNDADDSHSSSSSSDDHDGDENNEFESDESVSSHYWIVAAINPDSEHGGKWSLKSVSGKVTACSPNCNETPVPTPSPLLLLPLGMMLLRRKKV